MEIGRYFLSTEPDGDGLYVFGSAFARGTHVGFVYGYLPTRPEPEPLVELATSQYALLP
jgi:hypothetical protein